MLIVAVVLGSRRLSDALDSVIHLSPLVIAVVVGIALGNSGIVGSQMAADIKLLGKLSLRIGVALLGFRLALGDVRALGAKTLACVVVVVLATFFATQWFARVLGLSRGLGLLIGTGYAICGASAIAAMEPNAEAEPEEVAYALSLVTLCGTLSIAVLPPIGHVLHMSAVNFGIFAGSAVHDVAQVVATSSAFGDSAQKVAAVVKLSRVVMLAPMVTLTSLHRRRSEERAVASRGRTAASRPDVAGQPATDRKAAPTTAVVPLFVACFLAAMILRTAGWVPSSWLGNLKTGDTLCLAAGMFSLGLGTSIKDLRTLGGRPLVLGLASWALVAGMSLALVLLTRS